MKENTDAMYWPLMGWAVDLCRCIEEMPKWRKIVILLVLGRFAAREYVGMRDELNRQGYPTDNGYGLEGCDYHADKLEFVK